MADKSSKSWDTLYRVEHSYRNGPVLPCFSWPSDQTVTTGGVLSDWVGRSEPNSRDFPGWRAAIKRGTNATTQRDVEFRSFTYTPGRVFSGKWCGGSTKRFGYRDVTGDLSSRHPNVVSAPSNPPTTLNLQADALALQRFVQNARQKQGTFRGSTFLAEIASTIAGLRNPAKGIRNLLDHYHLKAGRAARKAARTRHLPRSSREWNDFRKANPRRARDVRRAVSDSWLEGQFGWIPLSKDINDAFVSAANLNERQPRVPVSGYGRVDNTPTFPFAQRVWDSLEVTFNPMVTSYSTVKYYGAVKCEVDTTSSDSMQQEFGFQARDFLPAVWEAIPYSFLVDYFSNIGNLVEALSFPHSDILWAGRTYRNVSSRKTTACTVRYIGVPQYPTNSSMMVFDKSPSTYEWTLKSIHRGAYYGSYVPRLQLEIPGSKNWRKWLNIAALGSLRIL